MIVSFIKEYFLNQASRGLLHKAVISGQYKTVKILLECGEDVDQGDQVLVFSILCKFGVEPELLHSLRAWILE